MKCKIAVIGAGVSGFSSATCIQENIPSCDVTIIAENVTPDITSEAAAGSIEMHYVDENTKETLQRWMKATLCRVSEIFYKSDDVKNSGISALSGYMLTKDENIKEIEPMATLELLPHWHNLSAEEMNSFPEFKSGIFMNTFVAESALYVRWMQKQFEHNGGKLIKKKISSFEEIADEYDAIINCTGLGAIELVKDHSLLSIKGHILKVEAPWVKSFYRVAAGDITTYIIPGTSSVSLGGTYQKNNWDQHIDINDSEDIYKRCCALLPSLKNAKIIREVVGWRPYRAKGIRLEAEIIPVEGKTIFCVHNYGHAGKGVAVSWGCAMDVTKHLKMYFNRIESKL